MHGCVPQRREVLFHTPHAEHGPRSGRGGRGRSNAGGRRAPPAMAAIQGALPPFHLTAAALSEPGGKLRRSTRRQPEGANMVSVAGPTRSAPAKSSKSKKVGTPTGSQSRKN
jgi:hypothetical protein